MFFGSSTKFYYTESEIKNLNIVELGDPDYCEVGGSISGYDETGKQFLLVENKDSDELYDYEPEITAYLNSIIKSKKENNNGNK